MLGSTHLRVLTDGDRGMSKFVQASALGTTGHVLDWFHIAMRLHAICRSLGMSLRPAGYSRKNTRLEERELESIWHHLWHGDIDLSCELLGTMRNCIETFAASGSWPSLTVVQRGHGGPGSSVCPAARQSSPAPPSG
jgi:hypothetical protein